MDRLRKAIFIALVAAEILVQYVDVPAIRVSLGPIALLCWAFAFGQADRMSKRISLVLVSIGALLYLRNRVPISDIAGSFAQNTSVLMIMTLIPLVGVAVDLGGYADALSLAAEESFDAVLDVATLTGGCIIALARVWTGVMGNNQALIDAVIAAGAAVGEKMWQLPFDPEVRALLDSDVADLKNSASREGSAIQGGMFLQEFAGGNPWVHLDIAGTSYLDKPRAYEPKGSTGVPVRTLVEFVLR